ncbi:hypothetical protein ACFVAE_12965 [Microbacterium sp. NPDC057659]|uniref:hypothetical protein n=1 Tax=Microbacterium sp. NPDC057659 TaxID=3346198 RepID=UPI0036717F52
MGGKDVTIDYDLLEGVRSSLKELIAELEDAPERNSDIAGAIDSPFEKGELQGAAADFRGAWEPKRTELIDELQDISTYISDVIDSYYGLDRWF